MRYICKDTVGQNIQSFDFEEKLAIRFSRTEHVEFNVAVNDRSVTSYDWVELRTALSQRVAARKSASIMSAPTSKAW